MSRPDIGSNMQILSCKHDGKLHRMWDETTVLDAMDDYIIGGNYKTRVTESDGSLWRTKDLAICYFHKQYWFNIIGMFRTDGIHYYCNMSSPFEYQNHVLTYIDYDLDIKISPDLTYDILDKEEYNYNKKFMSYSHSLENTLSTHLAYLLEWIKHHKGPFAPHFMTKWYRYYLTF